MASIRNKSEHTLNVRVLNRSVDPDEQVDVPDDIFEAHTWPETVWEITESAKAAKASRKGE